MPMAVGLGVGKNILRVHLPAFSNQDHVTE